VSRRALIAVDVQHDFLPGGSLAVAEGFDVIAPLKNLASHVDLVVATRDFHPRDHCSFTLRGGSWPEHCVIGSHGAQLHPEIDAIAQLLVSKGMQRDREAYSGFDDTELAAMLRARGVTHVIIGGLATDYCVRATALAASSAGFETTVVEEAVRAVDVQPGDGERAVDEMRAHSVSVAPLQRVVAGSPVSAA
jgi:nicotinamidase-related amidase